MYDSRSVDKGLRGKATIHRHMHKKGCTLAGVPLWTDEEQALVRAHYPDIGKLEALLVRRTPAAIKKQAHQLGLVKPRTKWSSDEVRKMPPPYKEGDDVRQSRKASTIRQRSKCTARRILGRLLSSYRLRCRPRAMAVIPAPLAVVMAAIFVQAAAMRPSSYRNDKRNAY